MKLQFSPLTFLGITWVLICKPEPEVAFHLVCLDGGCGWRVRRAGASMTGTPARRHALLASFHVRVSRQRTAGRVWPELRMQEPGCLSRFARCLLLLMTAHAASVSAVGDLRPCEEVSASLSPSCFQTVPLNLTSSRLHVERKNMDCSFYLNYLNQENMSFLYCCKQVNRIES